MMKSFNGEIVEVTRDGVPVAHIVPIGLSQRDIEAAAAMEAVHRFRREQRPTLGGNTIREMIEEGRM